jgi:GntR family transcriptional repressor for pyruvate dehydrogenase complex
LFIEIPRTSTAKAIETQVKRLIFTRQLVAGEALPPEREFAARLGVSRSTLREALRSLSEQGIVTGRQGSGWLVHPDHAAAAGNLAVYFRLEDVTFQQVFEARMANEPTIARLAAERRTDAELDAIEAALGRMDDPASPEAFLAEDTTFHALIGAAAHNILLSFQMTPTMSLLEDARLAVLSVDGTATSQVEHRRIVEAIRDQDADEAEQAMREHIASFASRGRATLDEDRP